MVASEERAIQRQGATLKDVAERAGVSVATVSRVINNVETVLPENREKVLRAMAELRYSPNDLARSLRKMTSFTVGMLAPEISNPFSNEVATGAQRVLQEHGYLMMISDSQSDLGKEEKNLQAFVAKRVDGLLVTSVDNDGARLERISRRIPVVQIDHVSSEKLDSVRVDNIEGAFHAVSHLVTRGYRRIATIAGRQSQTAGLERLEGYRRALAFYGLAVPEGYIRYGDFVMEGGYHQCHALLREHPDVEALFVASNFMGIGALRAIKELGLRIPEDVAICVFDDFLMADMINPPITVVAQPVRAIGETAARLLLERMQEQTTLGARQILLKPKLIVRAST